MDTLTEMTRRQAQNLMEDLEKNLQPADYIENIYVSIKHVGTKVFRQCAYHETEGYTFIWTMNERFIMDKKQMGDFVIFPYEHGTKISLKDT